MRTLKRAISALIALLVCTHLVGCSCSSSKNNSPPSGLAYASNPALYALNVAIEPNVPTVSGEVRSWSVRPALPAGLVLDGSTGTISGVPTATAPTSVYVVQAGNDNGSTTVELTLAVLDIDPPTGLSYAPSNPYDQGLQIDPIVPTVTGLVLDYAVAEGSEPLPAGLELNPTSGVISGRPLVRTTAATTVVIEASNPAGMSSAMVDLEVAARPVRFVYVANNSDQTLGTFGLDSSTGQLTPRGYATTGERPRAVVPSPLGTSVYVANFFDGTVSVYFLDGNTGAPSLLQTVASGTGTRDIAVHPSGSFVYALNGLGGDISRFTLDEDTGELVPVLPSTGLGAPAEHMAMDPTGRYLYVAVGGASALAVYAIDPASGSLAFLQNAPVSAPPTDVVVDPGGRFVYTSGGSFRVSGLEIDDETGFLATIPGSPWTVGPGNPFPVAIAVSADGRHLYTANNQANNVSGFEIDPDTGGLTALVPPTFAAGTNPLALALAGQDEFLFVTHSGSVDAHAFAVDADGLLTPVVDAPVVLTGVDPLAIATVPAAAPLRSRTDFVYVANEDSSNVSAYTADSGDGGTGDLTPVAGSPFASGATPRRVTLHPGNGFLYSADFNPGSVSLFTVNASTGALTPGTGIGVGIHSDLLIEPSGRFAYGVLPGIPSTLAPLGIDPDTGQLSPVAANLDAGDTTLYGEVHPTGRFLYVASTGSDSVSGATIFPTTGALAALTPAGSIGSPQAVAIHPTGRFLYAPNAVANTVGQWAIDPLSGTPTALVPAFEANPTAGGDPTDVAVHPTGRFLYVSNGTNNEVLLFTVDADTGLLTGVGSTAVPAAARGVIADASGRFLYVTTAGNQVVKFAVDPMDGSLSASSTAITGSNPRGLTGTRVDF